MKEVIYLAGQISVNDVRSYQWRENVKGIFHNEDMYEVIDPCGNKFNQSLINKDDYQDHCDVYNLNGTGILVPKDKSYVTRSTIAIVNMIHYDKDKPIVGTCFELAWYNFTNDKTVIGIYEDNKYSNHPFVKNTVTVWVSDEYEACHLIKHYFD